MVCVASGKFGHCTPNILRIDEGRACRQWLHVWMGRVHDQTWSKGWYVIESRAVADTRLEQGLQVLS